MTWSPCCRLDAGLDNMWNVTSLLWTYTDLTDAGIVWLFVKYWQMICDILFSVVEILSYIYRYKSMFHKYAAAISSHIHGVQTMFLLCIIWNCINKSFESFLFLHLFGSRGHIQYPLSGCCSPCRGCLCPMDTFLVFVRCTNRCKIFGFYRKSCVL